MSLVFKYGSRVLAFPAVNLGTAAVRLGKFQVTMAASMGDVGSSSLAIDDPTGDSGYMGDQIRGYHTLEVTEDECAVGNQVILSAYTGARTYADADSLKTGDAVRITMDLSDVNRVAQLFLLYTLPEIKRPAETVGARLTWLISSTFSGFVDSGLVVYPTTLMDANDYTNQPVSAVLDDCAQTMGYNWFIYKSDETASDPSLFFDEPNTSTAYSSDLRISNVRADVDSDLELGDGATHTWYPLAGATLKRDPQHIASTIILPWAEGTDTGARAATSDIYGFVDVTAADSNVKSLAAADLRVNRLLWQDSTEEDVITVSLNLPRANVNDIREGQRMQAKFRQLPGYKSSYSWFRVMYRTVSQAQRTDEFYTVDLTLSPQEAAQPAGHIVQSAFLYAAAGGAPAFALPNPITIGNLLVVVENRWKGNGVDPVAPYIGSGGIGGTNVWNASTAIVTTSASGDRSHVGMWTKTATATTNSGPINSAFTWIGMYEISGTTSASFVSKSNQVASTTLDVGSLGSPGTNAIGIMVAAQYTPDVGWVSYTPDTGWIVDTSQPGAFFGTARPQWMGHLVGTGAAVEARLILTYGYPWCGIAGVFAP